MRPKRALVLLHAYATMYLAERTCGTFVHMQDDEREIQEAVEVLENCIKENKSLKAKLRARSKKK